MNSLISLNFSGPQPNWDPDIVEALDDDFDMDDPDNQLEDDFILKANKPVDDEGYVQYEPAHEILVLVA